MPKPSLMFVELDMKEVLDNVLIVKVGTSTQIRNDSNGSEKLDEVSLLRIGQQIVKRSLRGEHTIIVTSGAITAGMLAVGLIQRPSKQDGIHQLQRLASIGWRHILNAWSEALGGLTSGSVLLTKHELGLKAERDEIVKVTHTMLQHGDIVVANENDVVVHDEIAFGDNDTLAATYAAKLASSGLFTNVRLLILSDVEGLYADQNDSQSLISTVKSAEDYRHLAGEAGSAKGTGGMKTKLDAAEIANQAGITMWLANGRADNVIERSLAGEIGTVFNA